MIRRWLCIIIALFFLSFAKAGLTLAQNTKTTTTTTTQTTATGRNPDGSYTVVEYPVGKEVAVKLTPTGMITSGRGIATIMRMPNGTSLNVNLSGLPANLKSVNLYAIDPTGKATLLGPVTINNGVGKFSTTTLLDRFMLIASPEDNLTSIAPSTTVLFRSAVPQGFAVVPLSSYGGRDSAPVGERVAATSTAAMIPAYNVPMLGINNQYKRSSPPKKFRFSGLAPKADADVFISPRSGGVATVRIKFKDLPKLIANDPHTRYVVWALSPDNRVTSLGQVLDTGANGTAELRVETALAEFGLFITAERSESLSSPEETIAEPSGPVVAVLGADNVGSVSATIACIPVDNLNVKYCRTADCPDPDTGPWNDTATGANGSITIPLEHPAKYTFMCTDRNGKKMKKDVPCYTNCTVTFDIR